MSRAPDPGPQDWRLEREKEGKVLLDVVEQIRGPQAHKPPVRLPGHSAGGLAATRTAIVAITPPTDIVLDVARAADPDAYRAAAERLARLRATSRRRSSCRQASAGSPNRRSSATGRSDLNPLSAGPARTHSRRAAGSTPTGSSKPSCCRASCNRCCRRMPPMCLARAAPASSGNRCWPKRWATSLPAAVRSASPGAWRPARATPRSRHATRYC